LQLHVPLPEQAGHAVSERHDTARHHRNSILKLAREIFKLDVEERPLPLEEVLQSGDETFGCGTAAVISPIGKITAYHGRFTREITSGVGELSRGLYDHLTGIQWGEKSDLFNWVTFVE
jgi:branched-chain amino acid aminotransferase